MHNGNQHFRCLYTFGTLEHSVKGRLNNEQHIFQRSQQFNYEEFKNRTVKFKYNGGNYDEHIKTASLSEILVCDNWKDRVLSHTFDISFVGWEK